MVPDDYERQSAPAHQHGPQQILYAGGQYRPWPGQTGWRDVEPGERICPDLGRHVRRSDCPIRGEFQRVGVYDFERIRSTLIAIYRFVRREQRHDPEPHPDRDLPRNRVRRKRGRVQYRDGQQRPCQCRCDRLQLDRRHRRKQCRLHSHFELNRSGDGRCGRDRRLERRRGGRQLFGRRRQRNHCRGHCWLEFQRGCNPPELCDRRRRVRRWRPGRL